METLVEVCKPLFLEKVVNTKEVYAILRDILAEAVVVRVVVMETVKVGLWIFLETKMRGKHCC